MPDRTNFHDSVMEEPDYDQVSAELDDQIDHTADSELFNEEDEDISDTDQRLWEESPDTSYNSRLPCSLPRITTVQRALGLYVQFTIDGSGQVIHRPEMVDRGNEAQNALRLRVAEAVSEFLIRSGSMKFASKEGGWVQIPRMMPPVDEPLEPIGKKHTKESLPLLHIIRECCGKDDAEAVAYRIHARGSSFLRFGIRLPGGDVIQPTILFKAARKTKRATKAAALRLRTERPETVAGEAWNSADWKIVSDSVTKNRSRKAKKGSK